LVPVITLSEGLAEKLTGGKLVLENVGQYHLFTANSFTISPIDFGIEDIRIGIGAGSYIITSPSGVPQAGGSGSATGTGGYVVAYYKENTLEEVLANENLPQVRVNVDVELGEATEIVGIIPNTAALGTKGNASFWRNNANGRQALSGFVLVQFDNGTTAPYDATTHNLSLLAGDFDSYLEGRTTQDQEHPGWWLYVALKQNEALPSVGTTVSFKITSGLHFGEPAWTATITTQTTSANPETL
ncbi:MAG: hypothetical protein LBR26_14625, partial [Prevotella sp.]|nr:hypothetical protein [Prevotella sp.]